MINNFSRLKWACRRGMLELDVLLGNFLEEKYATLRPQEQNLFVELLSHPDPELIAWLMGHKEPEDPSMYKMTEMIRNHARSRF